LSPLQSAMSSSRKRRTKFNAKSPRQSPRIGMSKKENKIKQQLEDPFDMSTNSVRTKIRGGGMSSGNEQSNGINAHDFEDDVQIFQRSPIKKLKIIRNEHGSLLTMNKKEKVRRGSLQLKASLPAPPDLRYTRRMTI